MLSTIDITLLEWIQQNRAEFLDGFFQIFSGVTTFISIAIILTIGIFARFRRSCLKKMVQAGLTLFLAALISYGLKSLFQRERPFRTYDTVEKLSRGGSPSFPSGHTLEAFAVATSIALIFRRRVVQVPVLIWACMVAYSRMALGVHYPSDVLGGMLIGMIVAVGVDYGFRKWVNPP